MRITALEQLGPMVLRSARRGRRRSEVTLDVEEFSLTLSVHKAIRSRFRQNCDRTMFHLFALAFILLLTTPGQAHAYIDPGVASIVLQSLIAIIATVSATLGLFWHRVKSFFRMGNDGGEPSEKHAKKSD